MKAGNEITSPNANLWVFLLYVILLGVIAFGTYDRNLEYAAWSMTIDELIRDVTRVGDPISFATAGVDIFETGWIRQENTWIFNLWPPGISLLHAAVLFVLGREAPILGVFQCLALLLHSSFAFALYTTLRLYLNKPFAFLGGCLPYLFPVTAAYLLHPTGVALGETFAAGFFGLGVLAALSAENQQNYLRAVLAGICFALSAYFRSQFEFILLVFVVFSFAAFVIFMIPTIRRGFGLRRLVKSFTCLAVVIVISQAALLPWRMYHLVNHGSAKWVFTTDLVLQNSIKTDEQLNANFGSFVERGGGNVVCEINPSSCGRTEDARNLYFNTLLNQPIEWIAFKAALLPTYWFSPVGTAHIFIQVGYNSILALFLLASAVMILFVKSIRQISAWISMFLIGGTVVAAYSAIFTLVHFEARYFYFLKFISPVFFMISLAFFTGSREGKKSASL